MKSNNLILTLVSLFLIIGVHAQKNVEWKKENFPGKEAEFDRAYKVFGDAYRLYQQGPPFYEAALPKYLEAYQFNPDNDLLNFELGHIYYALHHPHDAERFYEK